MSKAAISFAVFLCAFAGCSSNSAAPSSAPPRLLSKVPDNVTVPKVLTKVEARYPAKLRQQRIQGKVSLQTTIDTKGVPRDLRVVSSDHPALLQMSFEALKQWRFEPGTVDGKPVEVLFVTTFTFALGP